MKRPWLNLILVPAILLALIMLPFLLYWSDLPNPMATHWGPSGTPDGSMPPALLLVGVAGLFVLIVLAVRRVVRQTPDEGPSFVAGVYAIGSLLALVTWRTVLANDGAASWEAADEVGLLMVGAAVALALAAGAVGWVMAGGRSVQRTTPQGAAPVLDVAEPSNVVWSGRGVGRVTMFIGVAVITIGLVIWGWPAVGLVLVGLIALGFSEVRATVSHRGVVTSLGWWGFPSWTVPLTSIERAEVEDVRPMAYGGYGYRVRPGVRGVVVRGGESLRLVLRDKADLVLTVDDAETAAGLLNAMLGAAAS